MGVAMLRPYIKLKFPRPFLGPAFNHNFFLREKLYRIHALPVHIAKERILPAAEWEERHRRGDTDIDSDIARLGFVSKFSSGGT